MNPIEKYVRGLAREEAEAVLAASETKLTLRVCEESLKNAISARPPSTRDTDEGQR